MNYRDKIVKVKSILEVRRLINKYKDKLFMLVVVTIACFIMQPNITEAQTIDTKAKSAIIVDVDTGKILFAKDADEALPPASMTKMMTEYIVLEHIANGDISWDTTTQISDFAYWISGNDSFSGLGLTQDVDYTVKSLYEAMAIYSDNGTSVALAELIAGSEGEFVKMMNEKAEELGLTDAKFVNSTGLDNESLDGKHPEGTKQDDTNLMSARDAANLGYHIVNDYPEALDISGMPETEFDGAEIRNYNWMLDHDAEYLKPYYYEGVDGLKTGNTEVAGYTFRATGEKDGQRLIVVVMKTKDEDERFKETAKLFDYGFDQFEETELFPANYQVEDESTIPVTKGKAKSVEIATQDAVSVPIEKGSEEGYKVVYNLDEELLNEDGELIAPIKKGEKVGNAEIVIDEGEDFGYILDGKEKITVDLVTTEEVKSKNWFSLMLSAIGQFFVSLFDKIIGLF